jgi:APAF-1 helical domain
MRVASLYDGSAWALVGSDILQSLQLASAASAVAHHQRLLSAYASKGHGVPAMQWADIPDDGYIMQNLGHHLVCADRLSDLRALLANPAWLECKLLAYGTGAVVADFRRCVLADTTSPPPPTLPCLLMNSVPVGQ